MRAAVPRATPERTGRFHAGGLHDWFKRVHVDRALRGGPERLRHEAAILQGWAA